MNNYEELIGKRIIITCKNNMSFAGILKRLLDNSLNLETDSISKFSILCPIDFIKKVIIVPIHDIDREG